MALNPEARTFIPDAPQASGLEFQRQIESLAQEMAGWATVLPASSNLREYLGRSQMQAVNSTVLPPWLTLVCNGDFPVLAEPRQHDYSHLFEGTAEDELKISHALHHVDEFSYQGHKVWLYDFPQGGHTSSHTHDKFEITGVVFGKIKVDGRIYRAGQTHIAPPGTYHMGATEDQPAIIVCTLMNGAQETKNGVHKF